MPYIRQEQREKLRPMLMGLPDEIETVGDLAYVVTYLMRRFWERNPTFAQWAAVRGAVEDQVDEMRRRVIAPYEDTKRGEHGDVF